MVRAVNGSRRIEANARKIRVRPLGGAQLLFGYVIH
jgi:hypothetical protein